MPTKRPRYKLMENRRIADVRVADLAWNDEPRTLLIRFTDGGTAIIEADCTAEAEPNLEIMVDGEA
jgi:hypothetical protein